MKYGIGLFFLMLSAPLTVGAQHIKNGYIDRGIVGSAFPEALKTWEKGQKWSDDDNFFISRVKPHERFRNPATQVNRELTEETDKKLIFWVPINNEQFNALPDGVFDSEVFPMWSYITHYGNWSTPLVRVPAGFLDVAHKNGVPVSAVASVPYGPIIKEWGTALLSLAEAGAEKLSDYLLYYGVDGIGYNSEFSSSASLVEGLIDLHENTLKLMKAKGNNIADIIWYDGTNSSGSISFDLGLGVHNRPLWGTDEAPGASLFFNYNWNSNSLLRRTVTNAKNYGRNPLDLYCGINMQGREPHNRIKEIWTLLENYPLSIGLWGAHSENMFFESRAELGASPLRRQRTYQDRIISWFTNGVHNPIASLPTINSLVYSSTNSEFMGMSKMMSARSALKWNLDDEPFITYFNLGNGKFFNWNGTRCHNSEWYNIAAQDYLPTWTWWFAGRFLGNEASDIVENGLKAEYVWDDAWNGGSTIRVFGTSKEEYLHLFKTEFPLKDGDEITFRYKLLNGSADAFIAMSMKGNESTPIDEESMKVIDEKNAEIPGVWTTRKFIVGSDITIPKGGEVAMIAIHFQGADDLDMRFGEFSIKRPNALKTSVDTPIIESTALLDARHDGVDGKLIFNMPNEKGNEVCYNTDVNTSLFKLYSQQEDGPTVLMGVTTSWAGLLFSAPNDSRYGDKFRFGVSALALNHTTESPIAWGEWHESTEKYSISDEIMISESVIKPGEEFFVQYIDPAHENADWALTDASGKVLAESKGTLGLRVNNGISVPGNYNLIVKGFQEGESGRIATTQELKGFIQVTGEDTGDVPRIASIDVPDGERVDIDGADYLSEYHIKTVYPKIEYTLESGSARMSRGIQIGENGLGFQFKDTGLEEKESFAVSFWFKPESFSDNSVHALNIRYKGDPWPVNNWGWMWHTLTEDGRSDTFSIRMASGKNATYKFDGLKLHPGAWYHLAYSFEFNENGGVKPALFVNGERQEITSWSIGDEVQGKVDFTETVGAWNAENMIAVGGYMHKTGSIRGNTDNFMVWKKALSDKDVAFAMSDIKLSEIPSDVIGFFDFETDHNDSNLFDNKSVGTFKVGVHRYCDTEVEGEGKLEWRSPEYCSGCPFTTGTAFSLTPTILWDTPGALVKERRDNGENGFVRLSYPLSNESMGRHRVSISAGNEYGESTDHFMLVLDELGSVSEVVAEKNLDVSPKVFDSEISVRVSEEGTIRLFLYSMEGRCVLSNTFEVCAGSILKMYPDVPKGAYILSAEKDGSVLGSTKLFRR